MYKWGKIYTPEVSRMVSTQAKNLGLGELDSLAGRVVGSATALDPGDRLNVGGASNVLPAQGPLVCGMVSVMRNMRKV